MAKVLYVDNEDDQIFLTEKTFASLNNKLEPQSDCLNLTTHLVKNGEIPEKFAAMIPSTYDAVVMDYRWESDKTCVNSARELRNKGYEKPIIVFSGLAEAGIKNAIQDFDELGLIYVDKHPSTGINDLYTATKQAIANDKQQQKDLSNFS